MSLVHADDLNDSTVRGEDHGASISLIIDQGEPGQGPGYTGTLTTRDG
jgi:hypothetical protein